MGDYVQGGAGPYSLAEACDHYLGILIEQACRSGQPVASEPMPWSDA